MRHAGHDVLVEVLEDRVERLAGFRRVRWQRAHEIPGLHLREHRKTLGSGEVVGQPVDDAVAFAAEGLGIHVAEGVAVGATFRHQALPCAFRRISPANSGTL